MKKYNKIAIGAGHLKISKYILEENITPLMQKVRESNIRRSEINILLLRLSNKTLQNIATLLNTTIDQVRNLEAKARRKLKHPSRNILI